jgi:hypothetical protein
MESQTKSISIAARIAWCREQKTQALTQLEREGWQAEEDGLKDALLNTRYNEKQYQDYPPRVFKRYVMGLQDGQTVLLAAAVDQHVAPPAHQARAERKASSDRMGDVKTRRMLGRVRGAAKIPLGSVWGHGA